jgi:hypothetical protein
MKSIAVIGIGSAGLQTLCHLCTWLDNQWKITSISDPTIPPIAIGESTNPPFLQALHLGIDFNIYDHLDAIKGTLKIGTVFKKWRPYHFINPLIGGSLAIHIDSVILRQFVLPRLKKRWSRKLEITQKKVTHLNDLDYDYIVDCRGFPKKFSDYIKPKGMLLNHALVHNIKKRGTWNYTGHRATKNGWMFEIPLMERQSYGYLFCDQLTSQKEALEDFSKEIDVPIDELDNIEYTFVPAYAKKVLEGRIFKNGNRALFFEPLSANSLFAYDTINRCIIDHLQVKNLNVDKVNRRYLDKIESIRDILYLYYHGGSIYDTPFWKKIKIKTKIELNKSTGFKTVIRNFKYHNKLGTPYNTPLWGFDIPCLKAIDEKLGYNYFHEL